MIHTPLPAKIIFNSLVLCQNHSFCLSLLGLFVFTTNLKVFFARQSLNVEITLHFVPVGYSNMLTGFKHFQQTSFAEMFNSDSVLSFLQKT
jgi:hypothetical protein